MKLNFVDNRPPQSVRVPLSAATYEKLVAYLEYNPGFSDVKQLISEICLAWVQRGDNDFRQWYKAHGQTQSVKATPKKEKKEKMKNGVDGGGWHDQTSTVTKD